MTAKVRNILNGALSILDGSGTPKTLVIPVMDGDLSFEEKHPAATIMNRGRIDSRKATDEEPMDVSFSIKFEQYLYGDGASTGLSVIGALTGGADAVTASWTSVTACGPWAVDLKFDLTDDCTGGVEHLTFPKFHADSISFKEGKEFDVITIKGKCLATKPTRTFTAP